MTDEAVHLPQDTADAIASFMRTAEVLANSGVSMLDIAGAMTVLLTSAVQCLPEPVRAAARHQYSALVAGDI